jgi:hypothetical protein
MGETSVYVSTAKIDVLESIFFYWYLVDNFNDVVHYLFWLLNLFRAYILNCVLFSLSNSSNLNLHNPTPLNVNDLLFSIGWINQSIDSNTSIFAVEICTEVSPKLSKYSKANTIDLSKPHTI